MSVAAAEPRIDRPITVRFRADWGQANMTRICGWLAQEMGDRSAEGSSFSIWAGRGGLDQVEALRAGAADIAVLTPAALAAPARDGSTALGIEPFEPLRALGTLGHDDRLVIAVDAGLPVQRAADLLAVADRLVIATCPDDGVNTIGLVADRALGLAGASLAELVRHGATLHTWERPFPALHAFETGAVNVVIQEAVMTPSWQRIDSRRPVRYLPWGDEVLDGMAALGVPSAVLRAGYLPGQTEPFTTIDFSDFQLVCRADLADDVAALAAWCLLKTRLALESQYRSFPQDRTPLTYPIDAAAVKSTRIPLHPAAERVYTELPDDAPLTEGLIWR